MGADISTLAERRIGDAVQVIPGLHPFDWRSYGMFGFLADLRNWSVAPVISGPRGLPADVSAEVLDELEHLTWTSWLSVDELVAFPYDQKFEDRRVTIGGNSGCTCEPGGGEVTTLREFLGEQFFVDLERLRAAGAERVVFGFSF